jgi:hypothetical protein
VPLTNTAGDQPFNIEDCWVYPLAAGVPGTGTDVPGIVQVTSDPQTTVVEHRSDGVVSAKVATLDSLDLTVTIGQWNQAAIVLFVGGSATQTGTTPNQIRDLSHKVTDAPADCAIAAQTHSKSVDGGGTRIQFPRCQHTGLLNYGLNDQEFIDLDIPMSAIATSTSLIVTMKQFETYAALATTWVP